MSSLAPCSRLALAVLGAFLIASAGPLSAASPFRLTSDEISSLAQNAPAALDVPIVTVTDKPAPAASGDLHDYISYARYYWPNPATADGMPFVNRDGHHNEEQVARGDHPKIWKFAGTVESLAAAWAAHHDTAAAIRAGDWLRAWFVDPATRMNPHLNYAQVVLGQNGDRGRSFGVLDARCLAQVIDALLLLEGSPALSPSDTKAVRDWFETYFTWLTDSPLAQKERVAHNNHGTWFLAQAIPIARYLGHDDIARELSEEDKARIAREIEPDGRQPAELARVDGLSYSVFNLEAHAEVARQAAGLGIDLWSYVPADGGGLRAALDFLRPYNANPGAWPYNQRRELKPGFLDPLIAAAARASR